MWLTWRRAGRRVVRVEKGRSMPIRSPGLEFLLYCSTGYWPWTWDKTLQIRVPTLFKWTHYFEVFACFKSLIPYNIATVLSITSFVSSSFKGHCLLVVWNPSHPPIPKPQHPCNMMYKIKRLKRKKWYLQNIWKYI